MSLQIWLPLKGDLHNQGLDQTVKSTSNSGAIINNNGKIGKCYSFDGVDDWTQWSINKENYGNKPLTLCCWFKSDKSKSSGCIIDIAADLCLSYSYTSNTVKFSYWRVYGTSSSRSGDTNTTSSSYDANIWHHVTIVFDNTINKIYVDGNFIQSWQSKSQTYWVPLLGNGYNKLSVGKSAGSTSWTGGLVNDVRIYDHTLSDKEIKEISQGLVLHYPLNNNGLGNENLLTGTQLLNAGPNIPSGVTTTSNAYLNFTSATYNNSAGTSYHELLQWVNKITVLPNEVYTASFYAKSPVSATLQCYFYNNSSNIVQVANGKSSSGTTTASSDGSISIPLTTNWERYWITYTFNSTTTSATKTLLFRCLAGKGEMSICGVKLEKGNMATNWSPAKADTNYPSHYNTNIYDISGYNNNGILNDTTTALSNSIKYFVCLKNNQTSNSATYLLKGDVDIPESNALTFSWWMNPTSIGVQTSGIFSTSSSDLPTDYSTTAANMRDSCFDCCNTSGTCVRINVANYLTLNEWHHYALVYNGTQLIFYKDGEQKVTANQTGNLKAFTSIFPFYSKAGGVNRNTSGNLSDFRIYVTALSTEDILYLYKTSKTINGINKVPRDLE